MAVHKTVCLPRARILLQTFFSWNNLYLSYFNCFFFFNKIINYITQIYNFFYTIKIILWSNIRSNYDIFVVFTCQHTFLILKFYIKFGRIDVKVIANAWHNAFMQFRSKELKLNWESKRFWYAVYLQSNLFPLLLP